MNTTLNTIKHKATITELEEEYYIAPLPPHLSYTADLNSRICCGVVCPLQLS